jgi:hypothetical protein
MMVYLAAVVGNARELTGASSVMLISLMPESQMYEKLVTMILTCTYKAHALFQPTRFFQERF